MTQKKQLTAMIKSQLPQSTKSPVERILGESAELGVTL